MVDQVRATARSTSQGHLEPVAGSRGGFDLPATLDGPGRVFSASLKTDKITVGEIVRAGLITPIGNMDPMERIIEVFQSPEEADLADQDYYATLTPQQRLDILLDLVAAHRKHLGETADRFERVCRITELSRS